jgi:hypothetical protein
MEDKQKMKKIFMLASVTLCLLFAADACTNILKATKEGDREAVESQLT